MHSLTPMIKCNALHYTVDSNIIAAIHLCLQNGAKTDAQDDSSWTRLMRASMYKFIEPTPSKELPPSKSYPSYPIPNASNIIIHDPLSGSTCTHQHTTLHVMECQQLGGHPKNKYTQPTL